MFQGWRIKIREAEAAYQQGLLDEASRLLKDHQLDRYLPGKKLIAKVAGGMAERARRRIGRGETSAGFRDLECACAVGGDTDIVIAVRQEIVSRSENEVKRSIENGEVISAFAQVEKLQQRGIQSETLQQWKEIARHMKSAEQLRVRGKFSEADQQLGRAIAMRSDLHVLARRRGELQDQQIRNRKLMQKLHDSIAQEDWNRVLKMAERMLEIAPENTVAMDARDRAWAEVGAELPGSASYRPTEYWSPSKVHRRGETGQAGCATLVPSDRAARFVLWVDAVGGYLVCLSKEVLIGQAVPGNHIDLPIQADLSRRHAKVKRQGEGYVIEPFGKTRVAGQTITETTLLTDGDEIELGDGVKLRFRQPHALSATARLDFVSRHSTRPYADAVLLMAESCVLGPHWQNHVVCRDWSDDVVLFQQDDQLYCRSMGAFAVDGEVQDGKSPIRANSQVCGDDFSMCLEALTT